MGNRFLKQLLYGFFFLSLFGLFGGGVYYSTKPIATCFDNIQNGLETGVDCGGPSCVSCAIKNLNPVKVLSVNVLPVADNLTTLVAVIRNPNNNYGLNSFAYDFISSSGEIVSSGESWLYAGETKYLIVPAISGVADTNLNLSLRNTSWLSRSELTPPSLGYSGVSNNIEGSFIITNGLAVNQSSAAFTNVVVGALFKNSSGQLVGASQTVLPNIPSLSSKSFRITHPVVNADLSRTELFISARLADLSGIKFDL